MCSLKSWPILSFLPTDLALNVVQAFVFGGAGNEAIVTLKSGEIYALGFNGNGCLGVGDGCSTLVPKKVEVLSNKNVVNMAYGSGPHVLAVTGKIFHINCYQPLIIGMHLKVIIVQFGGSSIA